MNSWEIAKAKKALVRAGIDPGLIPTTELPVVDVSALSPYTGAPATGANWDGGKFYGGFGITKLYELDYWTLRERSGQMFVENMYARGIIRRLITNEINTGLTLESTPEELILGVAEDALSDWAEDVENRYHLFGRNPVLCDHRERLTMGGLHRAARMEALISGDVLVVLRDDPRTRLPRIQLVSGSLVQTPAQKLLDKRVVHGVHLDDDGRHLGFYVTQEDGTSKYLPATAPRTGRRLAWLLYGTQNRLDDVRGTPLLSIILQSLKEVDRYKDAAQRKAVINSMLAMFIKKDSDKVGTLPITGGAVRKGMVDTSGPEGPRSFAMSTLIPGLVIEELQQGEEPVPGSNAGTDVSFGPFEEVMVQGMAWCLEIPPEILRLSFSSNYSASQAAINEFKIYLNRVRTECGEGLCQPHYIEWLISEALSGRVVAPGFLSAWRSGDWYKFYAWVASDWSGAIKPSTDILKQAKGYELLTRYGWITNDRAARELTGTKFSKNIKRLKKENELKAEAERPLAEFRREFDQPQEAPENVNGANFAEMLRDSLEAVLTDLLDNMGARA